MPDVHSVYAIVRNPNPGNPDDRGHVTTGYYIPVDGVLIMTDSKGSPVRKIHSGEKIFAQDQAGR
jgi:hypothetical protein